MSVNLEKLGSQLSRNLKQYTMLIALVAVVLFFNTQSSGRLLSPMNVSNLIFQNAYVIILAIGMLLCILTGGNIDLSVGSVVGVIGAVAGRLIITEKMDVHLVMAICVAAGIAIGMWQGFWIAYVRIPPFIVTLAGMLVFRGLTLIILGGQTIAPFPDAFKQYTTGFLPDIIGRTHIYIPELWGIRLNIDMTVNGLSLVAGGLVSAAYVAVQLYSYLNRRRKGYATAGNLRGLIVRLVAVSAVLVTLFITMGTYVNERMPAGVPTVLVLLGILLLLYSFFTTNTVMGRHLYAIGGNQKAARLSGIKTNAMMFFAYVNMAVLASVAGLVMAARLNSAAADTGDGFELDAIAACFIGGASAYGGIGTVGGTLIGALLMGVLNNGMSLLGIPTSVQKVVKGLVLLTAVAFDVISKKQTALPPFRLPFKRKAKPEVMAL
ncbi:MAG: sugar ABC transporter permease [Clostridia bacterium]|nr:sugar ABC transporter permease [Clostridia bacterium]